MLINIETYRYDIRQCISNQRLTLYYPLACGVDASNITNHLKSSDFPPSTHILVDLFLTLYHLCGGVMILPPCWTVHQDGSEQNAVFNVLFSALPQLV